MQVKKGLTEKDIAIKRKQAALSAVVRKKFDITTGESTATPSKSPNNVKNDKVMPSVVLPTVNPDTISIDPPKFGPPKQLKFVKHLPFNQVMELVDRHKVYANDDDGSPDVMNDVCFELSAIFSACDTDLDGFLSKRELINCLRMIGFTGINENMLNKYIPLNYPPDLTDTLSLNKGSGKVGDTRVSLDHFLTVVIKEMGIKDADVSDSLQPTVFSRGISKLVRRLLSSDMLEEERKETFDDTETISLRTLRHFLTEVPSQTALSHQQYKDFIASLGLLRLEEDSYHHKKKTNNSLFLASKERNIELPIDDVLNQLIVTHNVNK